MSSKKEKKAKKRSHKEIETDTAATDETSATATNATGTTTIIDERPRIDPVKEEEEIDVDFEVFSPNEEDWHAIKHLLSVNLLDESHKWNPGKLADAICAQEEIGSVVRTTDFVDNEGLVSLATVLSLKTHADNEAVKEVLEYVRQRAKDKGAYPSFAKLLDDKKRHGALLVLEKAANTPLQLSTPLYAALFAEVREAKMNVDYYVLVASSYRDEAGGNELQFVHRDVGMFAKHAVASAHVPITIMGQSTRWTMLGDVKPHKSVLLIESKAIAAVLKEIETEWPQ